MRKGRAHGAKSREHRTSENIDEKENDWLYALRHALVVLHGSRGAAAQAYLNCTEEKTERILSRAKSARTPSRRNELTKFFNFAP